MQAETVAAHRQAVARPASARRVRLRLPRTPSDWLVHGLLVAGALLLLFPFYWMVSTALKTTAEANAFPPVMAPSPITAATRPGVPTPWRIASLSPTA